MDPGNLSTIPQNLNAPSMTGAAITTLSTLIGVIVGGLITYLVTFERQKYELRRDTYLAFIGFRIKGSYPSSVEWIEDRQFRQDLLLAKYKIDLIGSARIKEISSRAVAALFPDIQIVEDRYKTWPVLTKVEKVITAIDYPGRWGAFQKICDNELKPAIQKELESWWQFWRRG